MSTTATQVLHKSWCNHHLGADPTQPDSEGACCYQWSPGGNVFVNIDEDGGKDGVPCVAVWGSGEALTPQEARQMAEELMRAADAVEAVGLA